MALLKSKIMTADKLPKKEKILIFSPHPDDDIISMGNTMLKLIGNGNEVHSIYMTPGSNAVFDHDVEKYLLARIAFDKVELKEELLKEDNALFEKVAGFLKKKKESRFGMIDTDDVRNIKTIIRQAEGASACLYAKAAGYKFLNPPFYQSGKAKKYPLTSADIDLVWSVLQEYKPTIVYAAGDLTDPNGTHRLCLMAIIKAFERFKADKPILWLYRGAWQEFHPAEADAFVMMNDADLKAKREGVFRHQSQKDRPPQPGHSSKEFW
jgi:glucosamine-6-phosphate deaminase